MLALGRGCFWALAAALVAIVAVTLGRLPPTVASHFDGAGAPNGWSSREAYAGLLVIVGALLPLGIIGLVHALSRGGPERLNIPARDYWLRPEHGAEAVRRVRAYIWWLGCILAATAVAVHALVLQANANQPPRLLTGAIAGVLTGVVVAIGVWAAGWYRLMRPNVLPGR